MIQLYFVLFTYKLKFAVLFEKDSGFAAYKFMACLGSKPIVMIWPLLLNGKVNWKVRILCLKILCLYKQDHN